MATHTTLRVKESTSGKLVGNVEVSGNLRQVVVQGA